MKFKSRKGSFLLVAMLLINSLFAYMIFVQFSGQKSQDLNRLIPLLVIFLSAFLVNWIYFSTYYVLDQTYLKYYSGPIKGSIKIDTIHQVVLGKTLWTGLKPATATKGIIVKFNTYDEIYISPDSNELFVEELLKLRPKVIVRSS